MPPWPEVTVLLAEKEKHAASPKLPMARPRYFEPRPSAASHTILRCFACRKCAKRVVIGAPTVDIDGYDRSGIRANGGGSFVNIDRKAPWFDIDELHFRANHSRGVCGGHECQVGDQYFVSGADPEREQRERDGDGAARHSYAITAADKLRYMLFKFPSDTSVVDVIRCNDGRDPISLRGSKFGAEPWNYDLAHPALFAVRCSRHV